MLSLQHCHEESTAEDIWGACWERAENGRSSNSHARTEGHGGGNDPSRDPSRETAERVRVPKEVSKVVKSSLEYANQSNVLKNMLWDIRNSCLTVWVDQEWKQDWQNGWKSSSKGYQNIKWWNSRKGNNPTCKGLTI